MIQEARLYEAEGDALRCRVCNHYCLIPQGKTGVCKTRENRNGKMYTLIYGYVTSMAADPIEKKPLYHFHPGSTVFSVATLSCNFRCDHCQNRTISFALPGEVPGDEITPSEAVRLIGEYRCQGIAWTYNEPTIWFEYTYDCARLAKKEGFYTVYVTNGYISREALSEISPYLDAANVDVKAFTEEFYSKVCKAKLAPVLDMCKMMKDLGIHLELTYLVIPTQNDSEDEIRKFAKWVVSKIGADTPVHFTRFFPIYSPHLYQTPVETLEMAHSIAREEGVEFAYIGNVYAHKYESTYCPECNELLIKRVGYHVTVRVKEGKCPRCGRRINLKLS